MNANKLGLVPFTSTSLTSNWMFKQGGLTSDKEYIPANDLPTEVHRDLLKNEKIPDPFKDLNELSVRWVGDETWTYRIEFAAPADYGKAGMVTCLKFEGLDTFASVYLNGGKILKSDNMFVEHDVNVSNKLQATVNCLEIVFESARKKGLELVKEHDEHRFIVHQTEVSRGPVRKAQYHWGWDWGPILMACGPWKPILLQTFVCKISDLAVSYELAEDLESAEVVASVKCTGPVRGVTFTVIHNKSGKEVAIKHVDAAGVKEVKAVETSFQIKDVDLWWPRTYGEQGLYTIRADTQVVKGASTHAQTLCKTLGFRKIELVQEPDSIGTSFFFRINNTDIFIGGSCWIPADSFVTRLTPDVYRSWVQLAADGNQTMLRVWGGGIYEADEFYKATDELGILVWQDFMFACANYPANKAYLDSVEVEARQNVRRIRHHPSVVIWAGNNEDYQIVERYSLQYDTEDLDPESWLKTNFPARYIYEHLLPSIIKDESPRTPYHPSSPFGNGKSTTLKVDPTIGDIHQWNVWHGTMEAYQRLPELGGRFVSEFGMEAYPHVSSLDQYVSRKEDMYPGSMALDFRNKAIGHERRLVGYVAENFRVRYDIEGFTHLTQVMQADAISWAYRSWRKQWGAPGRRKCGGVLVWQLNDCWPTMSWAVVDYHLVPKPAFYAIKRAMQPVAVGVQRKYKPWTMRPADKLWQRDTGHVDMHTLWRDAEFDVWVVNQATDGMCGDVVLKCYSIKTGKVLKTVRKEGVEVKANAATEVLQDHVFIEDESGESFNSTTLGPFVVEASLYVDGQLIGIDTAWPDPIKYLSFEDRGVEVQVLSDSDILVSAKKPVKGFVFTEKKGVKPSDNGFDLMPGQEKRVSVTGCVASELTWMYVSI
ncbi:glycoside hydrolase [Ophiobolus disseminans]|uniref:Beta-mannosidase B n=1 Tax=Ophiobolus disseminans TaxID=1469910 RepID=A0A6A6ZXU3_9PLEO|nr:glycoside hydrolase [Ophiobolus disseminans]